MTRFVLCMLMLVAALPAAAERGARDGQFLQGRAGVVPPASEPARKGDAVMPGRLGDAQVPLAVSVSRYGLPANPPALEALAATVLRQLAAQPGASVRRHGRLVIDGRDWYAIDLAATTGDDRVVENLVRITIAGDCLYILSINSVGRASAAHEAALRSAITSLALQ